ncbi:MAG: hypothetical protein R2762_02515 [Bryobacteraceae bacterium]
MTARTDVETLDLPNPDKTTLRARSEVQQPLAKPSPSISTRPAGLPDDAIRYFFAFRIRRFGADVNGLVRLLFAR